MRTDIDALQSYKDFVSDVLIHLNMALSPENDFAGNMTKALQLIGEFSRHDCIHIVQVNHNMTYSVRYEWRNRQVESVADKWKHSRILYDLLIEKQLCEQNYILISDTTEELGAEFKAFLKAQHCRQMLVLPLFEASGQFAFMVLMQCLCTHDCNQHEIRLLADLASVIAVQLDNYQLMKQLFRCLRNAKKEKERTEILQKRLLNLRDEFMSAWENSKATGMHADCEKPELEKCIKKLDELCHSIPAK